MDSFAVYLSDPFLLIADLCVFLGKIIDSIASELGFDPSPENMKSVDSRADVGAVASRYAASAEGERAVRDLV